MPELANRSQFESELSDKLTRLSQRHLRDLERLLGNPPDFANVPADFWVRVERDREEEQQAAMLLLFVLIAKNNGSSEDLARIHANSYAQRRAAELARSYALNARDRASQVLSKVPQDAPRSQIVDALGKVFSPSRDSGTAVTEITRMDTGTRLLGSDGASLGAGPGGIETRVAVWITRCDPAVCNCCWPLHRIPHPIHRLVPPFHPNCRCYLEMNLDVVKRLTDDCPRPTYGNCEDFVTTRAGYVAARNNMFPELVA